jgi:arylsulfatase A-like enzyme
VRSLRLLAALSWIAASSGAVGNPVGPQNLVLITLDTTRADHLGPYGAKAHATPVLDRIAAESVVFEHAVSVAPLTLPAHTSRPTPRS